MNIIRILLNKFVLIINLDGLSEVFHMKYFADLFGYEPPKYQANYNFKIDPTVVISALTAVTKNIGLTATATTTYNEPFQIARRFAGIDHLSKGRAAWNVVTSGNEDEAIAKREEYNKLILPEMGLEFLSGYFGFDLTKEDIHSPIPEKYAYPSIQISHHLFLKTANDQQRLIK